MTGLPSGLAVHIEFVAGTWTDVTADVDARQAISWRVGRTSPFAAPSPAMISVVLDNTRGDYTPQRQLRADGVTPHPYWPNVDVRKRIRISYTVTGTRYVRFLGYVKQWLPGLGPDGHTPVCVVSATDRLDQHSRVTFGNALLIEMQLDAPAALYAMREAAGNTTVADLTGKNGPLNIAHQTMALGAPTPTPRPDGLTGLQITNTYTAAYPTVTVPISLGGGQAQTLEAWITTIGATDPAPIIVQVGVIDAAAPTDGAGNYLYHPALTSWVDGFSTDGGLTYAMGTLAGYQADPAGAVGTGATAGPFAYDSAPHHFAMVQDSPGSWSLYYDGQLQAVITQSVVTPAKPALRIYCQIVAGGQQAVLGPVGVYTTPLSAARIAAHYAAGTGNPDELSGARIARLLNYAGVPSSDTDIDPGVAKLSPQGLAGKKLLDLVQQITTTEGGGAAFYVAPSGATTFVDRNFRRPGPPAVTVDAGADLDAGTFAPAYDELTLINSATVTREGGTEQTYTDTDSRDKYGLTSEPPVTALNATDQGALNLAQWRVRSQSRPGWRLAAVALDLLTATTANLYASMTALRVGSRLRATGLDATAAPRTSLELAAEGWTETVAIDQYTVVFDTSPADLLPPLIWNDTTNGRWQADGNTLTAAITASATTISVTTAAGKPRFTTAAGAYPMQIQLREEVLTLPTAPTGVGAQTFTGVLRGQATTPASAQAAGTAVTLYPAATWAL